MNKGVPAQAGDHGGAALSLMEEDLALVVIKVGDIFNPHRANDARPAVGMGQDLLGG